MSIYFKLPLLFLLFILLSTSMNAQEKRKSERYSDAYKNYLNTTCPIPKDSIRHFVYFARDRELIKGHPLLSNSRFQGAQIMYLWRELEPEKDKYDFTIIREDFEYLTRFGKKLFIQLQDVTFNPKFQAVPEYLLSTEYDGGSTTPRRRPCGRPSSTPAEATRSWRAPPRAAPRARWPFRPPGSRARSRRSR